MTDRQFKTLIRTLAASTAYTAPRDRFLFYLLGRTGLRITEALSLCVRDLYLEAETPFVRVVTLKRRHGPQHDEVGLDNETARRARNYIRYVIPRYHLEGNVTEYYAGPAHPLFPSLKAGSRDKRMSRRNAHKIFKTWSRRAGLPPALTLHSFRHYRATTLLRRTGDLELTRHQLRHRDIRNTQLYQHVDPDLMRSQLERAAKDDKP